MTKINDYYNTYYVISRSTVQYYFNQLRDWKKADEFVQKHNKEFTEDGYRLSGFCSPHKTYYRKSDITKYLKKLYFATDFCGLRCEPVRIQKIGVKSDKDFNDIEHTLGTWVVEPKQYGMWFDKALQNKRRK